MTDLTVPPELLAEVEADLDATDGRADRWKPSVDLRSEVLVLANIDGEDPFVGVVDDIFTSLDDSPPAARTHVTCGGGLVEATAWAPVPSKVRSGLRVLVLASPRDAVGQVGTLRIFDGFPCVDLGDGTNTFPLIQQVAVLPAGDPR